MKAPPTLAALALLDLFMVKTLTNVLQLLHINVYTHYVHHRGKCVRVLLHRLTHELVSTVSTQRTECITSAVEM